MLMRIKAGVKIPRIKKGVVVSLLYFLVMENYFWL